MLPRYRATTCALALSLAVAPLTACATAPSGGAASSAGLPSWAALAGDDLLANLTADEQRLDAILAAGAGITAEELPRLEGAAPSTPGASAGGATSPVAGTAAFQPGRTAVSTVLASTTPDRGEATGAAVNALSYLYEQVRESLGAAADGEVPEASYTTSPTANPGQAWHVEDGAAFGSAHSSVSLTDADGSTYDLSIVTTYRIEICPSAAGTTEGAFSVGGAVTFTPAGGPARRSTVDISAKLGTQVSDAALVQTVTADVVGQTAYGPAGDIPGYIEEPDGDEKVWGQLDFDYGDRGAAQPGDIRLDTEASEPDFGSVVDDLAGQTVQLLVKAQEDYFRDGNCVELRVTPKSLNIQKGESTGILVEPVSLIDGQAVATGTVRSEGVDGPGTVSPAGDQKVGTPFVYSAGDTAGPAEQSFSAASRRGIARGATYVSVTEGWAFDDTYEGVRVTGTKCDGLSGGWVMTAEGVGWDYSAELFADFDEELRASYTLTGSADGYQFQGGGEMWMEPVPGGYDIHASTGPNVFHVRAAPEGACA